MPLYEVQLKDGTVEKIIIPGGNDMSRQQLAELLEWSKENSEKRAMVTAQKARYKTIPAIEAYREMKRFQDWVAGKRRIF